MPHHQAPLLLSLWDSDEKERDEKDLLRAAQEDLCDKIWGAMLIFVPRPGAGYKPYCKEYWPTNTLMGEERFT